MRKLLALLTLLAFALVGPAAVAAPPDPPEEIEWVRFVHYRRPIHPGIGPEPACPPTATDFAFIRGGIRWQSFPVRYRVLNAPGGVSLGDAAAQVEAAFETWDAADDVTANFFQRETNAGVAVQGTVRWDSLGTGPTAPIAVTGVGISRGSKSIVAFEVILNSDLSWAIFPFAECALAAGPNAFDVQNIVAHEAGHVVGLDHVKNREGALLTLYQYSQVRETYKRTLGPGDVAGIRALY
ncbi:MAG: matrixin family metalloprotease [Chloroflexi bacterium]|nr:matrixin family metalloprotease [Chloroflexota bacterium]